MRPTLAILGVFLLFSFADTSTIKRISDVNYRYEFYTTNKEVSPNPGRNYYWFKGGAIHNSEYGVAGELLHKDFLKFYHSNQLAEAGKFKNGLKEGYWKTWFENGVIQTNAYWDKGQKEGRYYAYDKTGFLVETGKYKNDKKQGRWINYISKDTLRYRDGLVVVKKAKKAKDTLSEKPKKPGMLTRIFAKKKKDSINIATGQMVNNIIVTPNDSVTKKPGFFKRLFSKGDKKNKKQKSNDKGA